MKYEIFRIYWNKSLREIISAVKRITRKPEPRRITSRSKREL